MNDRPDHHITKDGSSTLYSKKYDQYYHNPNGSVSESKYLFFETPNVVQVLRENKLVTFFETGFGTGLNFLLLLDYYLSNECKSEVHFYSVEAFPVSANLKEGMNVIKPLDEVDITLHLFIGKFENFKAEKIQADFVFHDAFSPEVNEELWTVSTFEKLKSMAKSDAVLSTYCAASKARAAMAVAGWKLAKAKGALGKREMTLTSLSDEKLTEFKRLNEERLIERFKAGDFDR